MQQNNFNKKICEYLKVEDNVTSPTFSIVNNYTYANNHTISHFDFYRLESIDEVYNIEFMNTLIIQNLFF